MRRIPHGNWYCSDCLSIVFGQEQPGSSPLSFISGEDMDDSSFSCNTSEDNETHNNSVDVSITDSSKDGQIPSHPSILSSSDFVIISDDMSESTSYLDQFDGNCQEDCDAFQMTLSKSSQHQMKTSDEETSDSSTLALCTSKRKRCFSSSSESKQDSIIQGDNLVYLCDTSISSSDNIESPKIHHPIFLSSSSDEGQPPINELFCNKYKLRLRSKNTSSNQTKPDKIETLDISRKNKSNMIKHTSESSALSLHSSKYGHLLSNSSKRKQDALIEGDDLVDLRSTSMSSSHNTNKNISKTRLRIISSSSSEEGQPSAKNKLTIAERDRKEASKKTIESKNSKKPNSTTSGHSIYDDMYSIDQFHTPVKCNKARTAATPRRNLSFRKAVIASHKCEKISDGLREAQKVLSTLRSPQNRFLSSSTNHRKNVTVPQRTHNSVLMSETDKQLSPLLLGLPKPKKLDLSKIAT